MLRREMRKVGKITKPTFFDEENLVNKTAKQEAEFNKIHAFIKDEQRHFDAQLSMEKLAEELNISSSKLSMLVNQYSGYNFSDYINNMRVNDAKKLLSSPDFEAYTIVSIGLECGFNSKSTFYSAFKKFTGQTPSTYKNKRSG